MLGKPKNSWGHFSMFADRQELFIGMVKILKVEIDQGWIIVGEDARAFVVQALSFIPGSGPWEAKMYTLVLVMHHVKGTDIL